MQTGHLTCLMLRRSYGAKPAVTGTQQAQSKVKQPSGTGILLRTSTTGAPHLFGAAAQLLYEGGSGGDAAVAAQHALHKNARERCSVLSYQRCRGARIVVVAATRSNTQDENWHS